jgi:Acetyltransferase (GNAT) domain
MKFERLNYSEVPWEELELYADRTVFQTREWLQFIVDTQQGEPVVAKIWNGSRVIGYFTGLIIRRFGVRILGSPFPGWMTAYMGFNLISGASRSALLDGLQSFAFRGLQCLHVELCDRNFRLEDAEGTGFLSRDTPTFESDLTISENGLFAGMDRNRKRRLRAAEKAGVRIEEAYDSNFVADFYPQLVEVYAQRKLAPPYNRLRVEKLIQHLLPTGNLLLLRAKEPSGTCIATAIYVGMNKFATYWGTGSHRSCLHLGPNEALNWYAMRYWKKKGVKIFDWGGLGEYKQRYGGASVLIPRFSRSRFRIFETLRDGAKRAVLWKQLVLGRLGARTRLMKDAD